MRASGTLRVAVDPAFPPFESVNASGQIVGLDVDLVNAIADRLEVDAHFVTTGYDALYDALTVGRADIIVSALYPDPSRSHAFVFSRPYFDAGQVLLVSADAEADRPDDLVGGVIGCVFGTAGHMEALQWSQTLTHPPKLITVETPLTIVDLLQEGVADAVLVDHVTAQQVAGWDAEIRIALPPVTHEPYVIAARREDRVLLETIDEILGHLITDGTVTALIERWMHP